MPSYRFEFPCHDNTGMLDEFYSFVELESKSGDYYANNRIEDSKFWYYVEFQRKAEAVYFKTAFNCKVMEWDDSGNEPRTTEELLELGYIHSSFRVADNQCSAFEQWCEDRDFGVVLEMKLGGETWPYNIYAPNQASLDEAVSTWDFITTS